jgi:hypothetical protein
MSEEEEEKKEEAEPDEPKEPEPEKKKEQEALPVAQEVKEPTAVESPLFEKAKKHLVVACAAIALGLAVAGSLDRTTGGVILLIGWLTAVASLHRLGRAGSERRPAAKP